MLLCVCVPGLGDCLEGFVTFRECGLSRFTVFLEYDIYISYFLSAGCARLFFMLGIAGLKGVCHSLENVNLEQYMGVNLWQLGGIHTMNMWASWRLQALIVPMSCMPVCEERCYHFVLGGKPTRK